jgi:hypothetical protein
LNIFSLVLSESISILIHCASFDHKLRVFSPLEFLFRSSAIIRSIIIVWAIRKVIFYMHA